MAYLLSKISVVTPTADRPRAFALCERFIARQTVQPTEWLICDGGMIPAVWPSRPLQRAVKWLPHPGPPGAANLCRNLLAGIEAAMGDVIIFVEDDDYYAPHHISELIAALDRPDAMIAGPLFTHYWHISHYWRTMPTPGHSSLCQTGIKREAIPILRAVLERCLPSAGSTSTCCSGRPYRGSSWSRVEALTCVGIKGMYPGLGIGHRPEGLRWTPDPDGKQLREWIGNDAYYYLLTQDKVGIQ